MDTKIPMAVQDINALMENKEWGDNKAYWEAADKYVIERSKEPEYQEMLQAYKTMQEDMVKAVKEYLERFKKGEEEIRAFLSQGLCDTEALFDGYEGYEDIHIDEAQDMYLMLSRNFPR